MKIPIYFQTQFVDKDKTPIHSDGCCPIDHVLRDGKKPVSFRDFAHDLLDEWLDNLEENPQKVSDEILDGAHIIFSPCNIHEHDNE